MLINIACTDVPLQKSTDNGNVGYSEWVSMKLSPSVQFVIKAEGVSLL